MSTQGGSTVVGRSLPKRSFPRNESKARSWTIMMFLFGFGREACAGFQHGWVVVAAYGVVVVIPFGCQGEVGLCGHMLTVQAGSFGLLAPWRIFSPQMRRWARPKDKVGCQGPQHDPRALFGTSPTRFLARAGAEEIRHCNTS